MPDPATATPAAPSPIQAYLDGLHRAFSGLTAGEVASYIPELAKADPDGFAIVLATVDGQVYASGDADRRFSIQSISKPFVYGVALEDRGRDRVAQAIGVEPSGDPFNAISLEPGSGRPLNPMINAGAIAAAALVAGDSDESRLARVLDALSAWAGRPLDIDQAIFESERDTGHRNRAIGHLLRNHGIVDGDPEPALGLYFRQCAVRVDCRDLALMAATLANGGLHPLTGQRAVGADCIAPMLSVMTTCGMYDDSGSWVDAVGLPAKSGVGGGIIAVLPGQLGIGVYSPRLDARGNSARGVAVCRRISADLGLHFLAPPRPSVAALRASYSLQAMRSKRRRSAADDRALQDLGGRVLVFELQGDLRWATLEPVLRAIVDGDPMLVVLDFRRVGHVDGGAIRLLSGLASHCAALGQQLVLSRVRRGGLAELDNQLAPQAMAAVHFQPSLDAALEWCERRLLVRPGGASVAPALPALSANQLCRGLTPAQLDHLQACLRPSQHEAGTLIVRRGDAADALFLVGTGEVSVLVALAGGGSKRLSTLSAGMVFGESALLAGGQRSANVRADTAVQCWSLPASEFNRLRADQPALAATLLHNLLGSAWDTIGRLTAEVAALEG